MNIPQLSQKELLALKIKYGATAVANRIKTIKSSTLYLIKDRLDVDILNR